MTHTFDASPQDGAAAVAQIAVQYWLAKGAIGVGYEVHPIKGRHGNDGWGYRLTGMCPERALPLGWRDGVRATP